QPAAAGAEPHGLIVHGPVHRVAIARLLEQVERDRRVGEPRAHPADRTPALVLFDGGGHARDHGALLVGEHVLLALGVRDAVADAERLEVDGDVHGEARAVRPRVVRALRDVGVVVASVGGQRHTTSYGRRGLSRSSSYGSENGMPLMRPIPDSSTRAPTPDRNAGSRIGANITRSCMSCWILCSSASRFFTSTSTACSRNSPSM